MNDQALSLPPPPPPPHQAKVTFIGWQRIIPFALATVAVFLIGFAPMRLKVSRLEQDLAATQYRLQLAELNVILGTAAIEVRRGEYESARQKTADFFKNVTGELNRGSLTLFSPEQQKELQPLLAQRDDLITLLARSDPASAERLADLYLAFRKIQEPVSRKN